MMCFVASSLAVSCNKDNNENNSNSASIIGTWGCVHSYTHYWGTYDNEPYDHENIDDYKGNVIVFKEDGSYTTSAYFYYPFFNGGSWMIDNNTLIIDSKRNCEISTLNATSMIIKYEDDGERVDNSYIIDHRIATYEFKRQ